ncbi:MAG: WD40 repeat domain-containing protein [Armatimonadetes bacterium]|nr:WD40 repeat domain-containing protein [Armatimonadota bacterium]
MERTIEERVARLEKTNRLLVVACSILVALPLLAGVMAFQNPDDEIPRVIRAEKFELIARGKVMGALEVDYLGSALILYDREGDAAVGITAFGAGGGVIGIMPKGDSGPSIALASGLGRARLLIADGKETFIELGTTFEGAWLTMGIDGEHPVAKLRTKPEGAVLELFDKDGELLYRAPESSAGLKKEPPLPVIRAKLFATVSNPVEDIAMLADGRVAVTDGADVRVFDKDGKEVEQYSFPERVYRIVPNEDRTTFLCTLSDRTVWERDGASFKETAVFRNCSLGTGEMLIDNDSQLIYSGDSQLRMMSMKTKESVKLCDLKPFLGDVVFDGESNRLYVGSTNYGASGEHSVVCIDVLQQKVVWEVTSDDMNGLALVKGELVLSERMGIRVLDRDTGKTLRSVRVGLFPLPSKMDSFVFGRYVVHPSSNSIWDLEAPGGIKRVAHISDTGRGARISPDGRIYFVGGGLGYHEVQVADLSSLRLEK